MKLRTILLAPLTLLVILWVTVATAKTPATGSGWDSAAALRKADWVLLEGYSNDLAGRRDAMYSLTDYARRLNPQPGSQPVYEGAVLDLALFGAAADSVRQEQSLEDIRTYALAHPDHEGAGLAWAMIAQELDKPQESMEAFRRMHILYPTRNDITERYAQSLALTLEPDNLREALAVYDSLQTQLGANTALTGAKVRLNMMLADTAAVIREGKELIANMPNSSDAYVFLGDIYNAFHEPDSALMSYNRACEIDPDNAFAFYSRANHYNAMGDSVAFDRELFHVLKMESLDMDTKVQMMREYVVQLYTDPAQHQRITDLFEALMELHPLEPKLRNLYGYYLMAIDEPQKAVREFAVAQDLNPGDREGWPRLAQVRMSIDSVDAALRTIDRGLHLYPDYVDLYQLRAAIHSKTEDYPAAVADIRSALEVCDSTDRTELSNLTQYLADIIQLTGDTATAVTTYREAIKINPLNYMAMNNLAYLLASADRNTDEALRLIERALAMEEHPSATLADTYAWVLFRMRDYDSAAAQITHAMSLLGEGEESAEILDHAGDIFFFVDGGTDRALELWQEALELEPDNELIAKKVEMETYFEK